MAEGHCIEFGRFGIGVCKSFTCYGRTVVKDGTVYGFWKFYIWIKKKTT